MAAFINDATCATPHSSRINSSQIRLSASHKREPSGPLRVSTRAPLRSCVTPRTRKLRCSVSTWELTPKPFTKVILWTVPWGVITEFLAQRVSPGSQTNAVMTTMASTRTNKNKFTSSPLELGVSGGVATETTGVGQACCLRSSGSCSALASGSLLLSGAEASFCAGWFSVVMMAFTAACRFAFGLAA